MGLVDVNAAPGKAARPQSPDLLVDVRLTQRPLRGIVLNIVVVSSPAPRPAFLVVLFARFRRRAEQDGVVPRVHVVDNGVDVCHLGVDQAVC